MDVELLGPPALLAEGGARPKVAGRQGALLAVLALAAPRPVSRDQLLDVLWGDDLPGDPANALQQRISSLRRTIDPGRRGDVLVTTPGGYALRIDPDRIDARRFARLAARGSELLATGDPGGALAELDAALALWRGEALEGFADEPWARAEAARLTELRRTSTEDRYEAALTLGGGGELAPDLTELLARHPLRERLAGQLMLALYRDGRQAEALGVYDRTRRLLADELGVDPGPALQAVYRRVLDQDRDLDADTPHPAPSTRIDNLPVASHALVGREDALDQVDRLLDGARLVTLTGPGGAGKTTLATEVARRRPRPVHGTWLVELAPLEDLDAISGEVASLLGVGSPGLGAPPVDVGTLATALRDRQVLLLLDNVEHVVEAVAELAERVLAAAPGVTILATSREPLGVRGEQVWSLPALTVPDPDETDADVIVATPAVELLLERARQHDPWFALPPADARHAAALVRQLDGLPLAIELAAAQLRVTSLAELAASLEDHLALLASPSRRAPARHRTLGGVLDWSWDLLDDGQRAALAALAVPAGSFDQATAASLLAAAGYDGPALVALRDLVDRSLLVAERQRTPPRYRMLTTVRGYGRDRLEQLGLAGQVHAAHADRVEAALADHHGPAGSERYLVDLDGLTTWLDDARVALGWAAATDGGADRVQRIAGLLGWVWLLRGLTAEGLTWLDAGLGEVADPGGVADRDPADLDPRAALWASGLRLGGADPEGPRWAAIAVAAARDPADQVLASVFAAVHEAHAGRLESAAARMAEAEAAGQRTGGWPLGLCRLIGAQLGRITGHVAAVRPATEEALGLLTDDGLAWARALALDILVDVVLDDPDAGGGLERARELAQEGLTAIRGRRLPELEGRLRLQLGRALHALGHQEEARRHLDEAVRIGAQVDPGVGFGFTLLVAGAIARQRGELDLATSQLRDAAALLAGTGTAFGTVEANVELALTAVAAGDPAEATARVVQALSVAHGVQDPVLLRRAVTVAVDVVDEVEAPEVVERLRRWAAHLAEGAGGAEGAAVAEGPEVAEGQEVAVRAGGEDVAGDAPGAVGWPGADALVAELAGRHPRVGDRGVTGR